MSREPDIARNGAATTGAVDSSTLVFFVAGKSPKTLPGGLGAYAHVTSKIIRDLGHEIYVVGFSDRAERLRWNDLELLHVRTPFDKLVGFGAFLVVPVFVRAMREVIAERKPKRVIVYSAGIWGAAGTALKRALAGSSVEVRSIVAYFTTYQHEYDGHLEGAPLADYGLRTHLWIRGVRAATKLFHQPREYRMLRESDRIVVHYQSTREIFAAELPDLDPDRIVEIPYCVDLFARDGQVFHAGAADGLPHVVVLCRQDPRKGINTFLKAIKLLFDRGRRFRCTIAGAGVFLKANQALARRLGLLDKINFSGFVDSAEAVLESATVYVLPSVEEGAGAISLLEAMRKGVAIVATTCDGIPEDFVDGETALLVPPKNPEEMARAIDRVIGDPELQRRLGQRASAAYAERFQYEKMRQGVEKVLAQL